MTRWRDLRVLYHLALKPVRGATHADRLESFYRGQAAAYDDFRQRLLQGRQELYEQLTVPEGGVWVELGGGTASNLEYLGPRISRLAKIYVVDLSPTLLQVARERAEKFGWTHVETVVADAAVWRPPGRRADVVTFSYSLTMIPNWYAAIDNGRRMLVDGGRLGVVDFYVARKFPGDGLVRHGWLTRSFWPIWFARDNVFPSADHLPYLRHRLKVEHTSEHRARVPYLPLVRVPYYIFVGRKSERPS